MTPEKTKAQKIREAEYHFNQMVGLLRSAGEHTLAQAAVDALRSSLYGAWLKAVGRRGGRLAPYD
jgi:hypothetical protein